MKKKNDIKARNLKAIAGVQQYLMGLVSLKLNGVQFAPADLVKLFQQQIDAADKADAAEAAWHDVVKAQRAMNRQVNPIYLEFRRWVLNEYGQDQTVLNAFGVLPDKPKATPAVMVQASQKARATRAARHTMGKRQKQTVHGAPPAGSANTPPAGTTPTKSSGSA